MLESRAGAWAKCSIVVVSLVCLLSLITFLHLLEGCVQVSGKDHIKWMTPPQGGASMGSTLKSPLLLTGIPGPSDIDRPSFFLFYFVFAHAQSFNKATATGQYTWTPVFSKWLYPRMLWSAYCLLRQLSSGGGWQACNKTHSGLWFLDSPEPLIPACVGEEGSQLKPLKNFRAYNGLRAVWKVRAELRS